MLLFFVRHGDPVYSPEELTPLGLRQAEAVAKRLALYGIDKIYSSCLKRARQTATPLSEYVKKEPVILDWCSEELAWKEFALDLDDTGHRGWAFQHHPEMFNDKAVLSLGENWTEHKNFKGTSFESGMKRIRKEADDFLLSLGYKHDRENRVYIPVAPTEER
ncbi:MAG: histidine phosphatase family protein, partial [Clostridia bacterium]|nr:histidine phosphatase family protein [Clostridia bacterium]